MIPTNTTDIIDFELATQPGRTYALNLETNRIIGYTDGKEAVKQAIYLILYTERYRYVIYSWNYGAELAQLFGQPIPYVYSEIKRCINEALIQDDRIISTKNYEFISRRETVHVSFTVETIYGDINIETEVAA